MRSSAKSLAHVAVSGLALLAVVASAGSASAQRRLPTSNGFGAAVYDLDARRLSDFFPAIFQSYGPGDPVRDLLNDAYFGLRIGGQTTWLTDVAIDSAGYVPGTSMFTVEQRVQGRTIRSTYFSPWDWSAPALAMIAEVEGWQPGDALLTLQNLHVGRDAGGGRAVVAEETLPVEGGAIREAGERFTVFHRPLFPAAGVAAPPENPYALAQAGRAFPAAGSVERQVTDDAVVGFEFQPEAGGAGALRGGVLFGAMPEGASPEVTIEAETAVWAAWQAGLTLPEETPLARQQAAFMRMAQVRSSGGRGGGEGQILASLPPGIWNIAWVRDMAYSVAALSRIGALDEAWAALEFQLEAEVGDYVEYVGRPYLISVTRYFGNGREESDSNQNGPNIEWDDFGLFLWSLGRYIEAGGDLERLRPHWNRVHAGVLEVIESLIDETDLLVPDSSIWERHWVGGDLNDGLRQRFAWSSIANAAGLCAAARLEEALGVDDGDRWRRLAHRLANAVTTRLVTPDGVLGASLEQVERGHEFLDLAVVEAFNFGLLPADGPVARATWSAVDAGLRVAPARGFKRNDDGVGRGGSPDQPGWYDEQEWVFIDLRTEVWRRAAGLPGPDLTEMLRARAVAPEGYLILPELLGQVSGSYEGAQPMVGFGAAAFLLGLGAEPERFCDPPGPVPQLPEVGPPRDAGTTDARTGTDGAGGATVDAALGGSQGGGQPQGGMSGSGAALPPPQDAGAGRDRAGDAALLVFDTGGGGGCSVDRGRAAPRASWPLAALAAVALARRARRRLNIRHR